MRFKITQPPKLKNWKVSMTTNSTTIGPASYVSPMNKDITLKKYIFTPLYIYSDWVLELVIKNLIWLPRPTIIAIYPWIQFQYPHIILFPLSLIKIIGRVLSTTVP